MEQNNFCNELPDDINDNDLRAIVEAECSLMKRN